RSGSLLVVSHGNPLWSSIRRNARRLSPSKPCQPNWATSSRSPPMDFTGYRKSASTCPISVSILDPRPPTINPPMAASVWLPNCPATSKGRHSLKCLVGRPEAHGPDAWLVDASSTSVCGHESEDNLFSSATPKSVPWLSSLHSHPTRRRIPHQARKPYRGHQCTRLAVPEYQKT